MSNNLTVRYMIRMIRRMRLVALGIHAAYVVALLGAAGAAYTAGHGEPRGPLADWAAMDAAFATFVAACILLLAWLHVIASVAWFRSPSNRWVVATALPVVAYLVVVWILWGRTDLVGWQVAVTGAAATVVSVTFGAQEERTSPHGV